ncbi:MAG: 2-dehydropantoate 2-reductase [Burkholderiales bacterium]|nr:2-dehydropantoate 2-reductase [Burkholderiales bacterium]
MRMLIYGAGAIGGYLGAILSAAGRDVTLVTRGAQLEALSTRGLVLKGKRSGRPDPIRVHAVAPGAEEPPYDIVFVTLKAHQIAPAAGHIASLRAHGGCYVFLQNGVPWWYFDRIASPYAGKPLKTLDPDGMLARVFPSDTIVGAVAYLPTTTGGPGVLTVADLPSDRMVIGEVDNSASARTETIAALVGAAGWKSEVSTDIRSAKWNKLVNNAVWNLLCALTQASNNEIAVYPPARDLAKAMMKEAIAVARAVGAKVDVDADAVVDDVASRPAMLSSTLGDVRAGRQLELAALNSAIIEMGELTGVATPQLRSIGACAAVLDQRIVADGVAIRPVSVRG